MIFALLQKFGVEGVKSLQVGGHTDQFWLHSDHTHWLMHLHDNRVAVVAMSSDLLSYEVGLGGAERVSVKWESGEGGSWVQLVTSVEEDELSDRVRVIERGKPLRVSNHF